MNKLSQQKKSQLLAVVLLTLAVLAGLWFALISGQRSSLAQLAQNKERAARKLEEVTATVKNAPKVEAELEELSGKLGQLEAGMAAGDLYSWAINTIREFKLPYKVEIPQFSQIDGPQPANLIPGFPYKQATLTISGNAQFHDFGKFVADMENRFPYMRLVNLTLEPATGAAMEPERLIFKMDVVTLVKPSNS